MIDTLDRQVNGSRSDGSTYVDDPDELYACNLVRELFYRARDARRSLLARWRSNYKVLNNRVWGPRADPWTPAPEIAEIWPVVASLVAWETDQRPVLQCLPSALPFSPYADHFSFLADDMNTILAANFSSYFLDAEISKALWDVHTYGIGYFKTAWEPWLADGLGDTVFRRVDPFTIYPDPYARSMDQMNYIIEAKPMTLDDVERAWPGSMKRIASGWQEETDEAPHRLDASVSSYGPRVNYGPLSPATTMRAVSSARGSHSIQDSIMVTVLEAWVRFYEVLEDEDDPDSTSVIETWRCIVVCGNCILMDEEGMDINAFPHHPYDRLVMYDTGEWYGPCLVEFLASPQESINRIIASIEQNLMLMGDPMFVEDPRAKSSSQRLTNKPGTRVKARLDQVKWLDPPQMNPQIAVQLLQYFDSKIETISGMSAIIRGFSPSGRNAQGVLDSVQDAAFVRIRASLRELERALRGVGQKMMANIAEFYTEPRIVSIAGNDMQRAIALKSNHFYVPDARTSDQIPMRFNLLADAGSQLPTSREARGAEAERMFALGIIDVIEVLKAKQWPNYPQVASRVMQQQAVAGTLGSPPGARQRAGRST